MKEHYFKIKYGYSTSDQVSIKLDELEKAIYAQIKGVPVQFGNAYINGKNIISITPHYHKHTGWHDYYEPNNGEDWEQIKRDCPSYDGVIEHYKNRVALLMKNGQESLIGKNIEMPDLKFPVIENKNKQVGGVKSIAEVLSSLNQ
jgi:hypothetical protein